MGSLKKLTRKPIELNIEGIEGLYVKNIPHAEISEKFEGNPFDRKQPKKQTKKQLDALADEQHEFVLQLMKDLLCDAAGEEFDEIKSAKTITDLEAWFSINQMINMMPAILALFTPSHSEIKKKLEKIEAE